jgi:hypothetical protein
MWSKSNYKTWYGENSQAAVQMTGRQMRISKVDIKEQWRNGAVFQS